MKAGDKVVCISNEGFWHMLYPEVGEICSILRTKNFKGKTFLLLAGYDYELPGPSADGVGVKCGFNSDCFRPVDHTFGKEVAENIEKELIPELV